MEVLLQQGFSWQVCMGNQGVNDASPESSHTNAEVMKFPQGKWRFLAIELVCDQYVSFYSISG